jgi:excisionase family DNA binding protein
MAKKSLPQMFTIPQAAEFLGASRQAVWSAIKDGRLEATEFGHVKLVPRAALVAYKKTRRPGGPSPKKKRPS